MQKWNHSLGATVAVMALAFSSSAQTRTAVHKSHLTIEQLIDIKHPSDPIWSPDGTADVNVPFLESVWLVDEALKKGKGDLVTFMMYPGEFHYFSREHVLRDAWHRVADFFDANLHAPAAGAVKSR